MLRRLKALFERLAKLAPGERFQTFHHEQEQRPLWMRIAFFVLAFVAFAIGVVLAFIPGPAVLFFGLSAALLATQSEWIACRLDRAELAGRRWFEAARRWWFRRRRLNP